MKSKRITALAGALVVAATTLAACGGGSGGGNSAEVVWYTGVNPAENTATIKAFNKAHPEIKVTPLRRPSSELAVRYSKERASGGRSADVVSVADPGVIAEGVKQGWWDTTVEKPSNWPAKEWDEGVAKVNIVPIGIGYNTDKVKGDAVPKGWEDLLKPTFKGKLLLADPRSSPAYLSLLQIWADEYGMDFLSDFADQDPQLVDSIVPGNQNLGAGSASVLVPDAHPAAAAVKADGGPIDVVDTSPTTGVETFGAVSNNAQDPEAARAFYEFLLTEEGQSTLNGSTASSVLGAVGKTTKLPDGYIALGDIYPKAEANRKKLLTARGLN